MEAKIELQCPECDSKWVVDGKTCRRCGHKGKREDFIKKSEAKK